MAFFIVTAVKTSNLVQHYIFVTPFVSSTLCLTRIFKNCCLFLIIEQIRKAVFSGLWHCYRLSIKNKLKLPVFYIKLQVIKRSKFIATPYIGLHRAHQGLRTSHLIKNVWTSTGPLFVFFIHKTVLNVHVECCDLQIYCKI
jgi:hypothetical protein